MQYLSDSSSHKVCVCYDRGNMTGDDDAHQHLKDFETGLSAPPLELCEGITLEEEASKEEFGKKSLELKTQATTLFWVTGGTLSAEQLRVRYGLSLRPDITHGIRIKVKSSTTLWRENKHQISHGHIGHI